MDYGLLHETFACKSGQCISRSSICDGERDCEDGSDESEGCCTLPYLTPDITFTVTCPEGSKCDFKQGETVPKYTELNLTCNPGYKAESQREQFSMCTRKGWLPALSSCKKLCDPLQTDNMDLICYTNKKEVKCSNFLYAGVTIQPQCKTMYYPKEKVLHHELTCHCDGKWNHDLFTCVPGCGIPHGKPMKLISLGQKEKYGDSPWHAAIYDINEEDKPLICSGTIVTPSLIITAAHCMYDQAKQEVRDSKNYEVAVSKVTLDYNKKDNAQTRFHKVRGIFLHNNFYGKSKNYSADIAALWLEEPLSISSVVFPACLHKSDNHPFNPGENCNGKIVGWGATALGEQLSEDLLTTNLPFISYSRCLSLMPKNSQHFVTAGKFCAGNETGPNTELGDSGGGLMFRDQSSGLYYLRGVTSTSPDLLKSYTTFIDVTQYSDWIQGIENWIEKEEKKVEADLERECDYSTLKVKKTVGFKCFAPK
ncbi:hypothetical protein V9T40_000629 [Parthenolecanium corni]|uniref:Peptidase S1 domain-containing protein n=1 Tax=Parthenolecanium corni TaxID=536013 RepID=A0AAN9Y1T5_9HEMI